MHANHTATAALVLERLPSGDHAWLRPAVTTPLDRYRLDPARVVIADPPTPEFIPRAQLPRFIVRTTTEYMVFATSAEQALLWFDLNSDSAADLDTEILTFGTVEVVVQLEPEAVAS